MGIAEFEERLRELAVSLFSEPELTEENLRDLSAETREMLEFILSCNTFGQMENLFKKDLESISNGKKPSKAKYWLRRVFPPRSRFKYSNPFVYKHRIVYPFFLSYRMIANPIRHRRYLKKEIKAVKNISK